jgi:hypothetical protein
MANNMNSKFLMSAVVETKRCDIFNYGLMGNYTTTEKDFLANEW